MQTDMCFGHIAELRENSSLLKICNKTEHTYWCYKQEILPVMDNPRMSLLKHLKQVKLYRTIRDLSVSALLVWPFYCLYHLLMHEVHPFFGCLFASIAHIIWWFCFFSFITIHYHSLPFRQLFIDSVSQSFKRLVKQLFSQSFHQSASRSLRQSFSQPLARSAGQLDSRPVGHWLPIVCKYYSSSIIHHQFNSFRST